jgi:opacity protein-like surface antigen
MRRLLALSLAMVAVLVAAPAASAASPFQVVGRGSATYTADGDATAFSAVVRAGTIRFEARVAAPKTRGRDRAGRPSAGMLRLHCVDPSHRRSQCLRRVGNGRVATWVIRRPVKFMYDGTSFRLRVRSAFGFELGVVGGGRMELVGSGRFSHDGATRSYRGRFAIDL